MKRLTAVFLAVMMLFGATALAYEPDSYVATGGMIPDVTTYTGTWQHAYLQILNNHSGAIHAYQNIALEYYPDYATSPVFIPFKPISLLDITSDGVPELIFAEAVGGEYEDLGNLYIYSWNGSSVRCALFVPALMRLGANDVDLGYKIYTSSDANGTLVFEYHEYDTVVVLQMARNALNQFYLLNYMTEDYDNSTDKGTYVLNGAASTYKKYSAALKKMQKGKKIAITDYIASDYSRYGFTLDWESAVATLNGTSTVTPEPKTGKSGELYGLTIDKLATRKGPGTQYDGGGTYSVKDQYIQVLARAYDKRNGIWWVKCVIPYKGEKRILWTGYKRFDSSTLPLESIPIEEGW